MMTWGNAKDYLASLFAMPDWDRMSSANQRIGQRALDQAVSRVWYALNPSLRVRDAMVRLIPSVEVGISAERGHTYVDTLDAVDGTVILQKIFFNEEQHEIRFLETSGSQTRLYFQDTVANTYTGPATVDHVHYLLPPDFEGFEEVPAEVLEAGRSSLPYQVRSRNELIFEPRQFVQDYVSSTGEVKILEDNQYGYVLEGYNTAWTEDLVGQVMLADGRFWHIRAVDLTSTPQYAASWDFMTSDTGSRSPSTTDPIGYELKLQARRLLRIYASSRDDIPFTYRLLPPVQGRDAAVIPIPSDRALELWMQYYWILLSDSGSVLANNAEKQLLKMEAEQALTELSSTSRPYPGGPEHIEINAGFPADRYKSDPRILYQPENRRSFNSPARPSVDDGGYRGGVFVMGRQLRRVNAAGIGRHGYR